MTRLLNKETKDRLFQQNNLLLPINNQRHPHRKIEEPLLLPHLHLQSDCHFKMKSPLFNLYTTQCSQ